MVTHRRKKASRMRGGTTHGCGSKKKARGAGNRGGRGMTGRGKKSDHRKMEYINKGIFLGSKGFTMHGATKNLRALNIQDIQSHLESWVKEGKAEKKEGMYILDAARVGIQKILGTGSVRVKLRITAQECSEKAAEKIKKAGGDVVLPQE